MRAIRTVLALMLPALFAGCASIPSAVDGELGADPPTPSQVRANPAAYEGMSVRWGGQIATVVNKPQTTVIEVVSRELTRTGRPRETDSSYGRFVAVIPGFLDPAIYRTGRALTVFGTVDGVETRKVGDYDYPHPRVAVVGQHLWERRPDPPPAYRDPWMYHDPWHRPWYYDPWYPYGRHRYW